MITLRRYFKEQIEMLRSELSRLDRFNREVYTSKHEELEKRVETLEKRATASEELEKSHNSDRNRFYVRLSIVLSALTVLVVVIDQIFIDHVFH